MARKLKVERTFDSAHYLKDYEGKCSNLHGHTWRAIFTFKILRLQKNGISVDFGLLKRLIDSVLPDHQFLNNVFVKNPTAENLVIEIFNRTNSYFEKINDIKKYVKLESLELFETPTNSCYYNPSDVQTEE